MKRVNVFTAVLMCFAFAGMLSADAWNKKTKVKFSAPVQLPAAHSKAGVVTLVPGTYVFRLDESQSNRHIVQVTNERGDRVLTTILAMPDYRLNATSKTVMYFSERPSGHPPAIKSWFYPGDNFGHRFVYPKVQAIQIAAEVNQPVPSTTAPEPAKAEVSQVQIQTPAKQETAYVAQTFDKVDAADTAGVEGEPVKAEPVTMAAAPTLPKTASPVDLIALTGLALVIVSRLARRASAQIS